MKSRVRRLQELFYDEDGVATLEYALLLALVTVASIAAWMGLSAAVRNSLQQAVDTLREPIQ